MRRQIADPVGLRVWKSPLAVSYNRISSLDSDQTTLGLTAHLIAHLPRRSAAAAGAGPADVAAPAVGQVVAREHRVGPQVSQHGGGEKLAQRGFLHGARPVLPPGNELARIDVTQRVDVDLVAAQPAVDPGLARLLAQR